MNQYILTCNGGTRPGPSRFICSYLGSRDDAIKWMGDYLSSGAENRYNFDGTTDYAFRCIVMNSIDFEGNLLKDGVWEWDKGCWEYRDAD